MLQNVLIINSVRVGLEYALCLGIIFFSLLALAFFKRRTNKELKTEKVTESCKKALAYAETMLHDGDHKSTYVLLGSSKLGHLSSLIADAEWYAYQIGYTKRDILFEEISSALDVLASDVSDLAENGYVPVEEYVACINRVMEGLRMNIEKLNKMIVK